MDFVVRGLGLQVGQGVLHADCVCLARLGLGRAGWLRLGLLQWGDIFVRDETLLMMTREGGVSHALMGQVRFDRTALCYFA